VAVGNAFLTKHSLIDNLHEMHSENMTRIGGIPKSFEFFDYIKWKFPDENWDLWYASVDNKLIALCLFLKFNKTVEYFVPAIQVEYRSLNPLNLLLFEAMKYYRDQGFKYFNWGGTTLPSQESVYHFKKRFGGIESKYYYYTRIFHRIDISNEAILREYPGFFVHPFVKEG
jgi:hypothetical protein